MVAAIITVTTIIITGITTTIIITKTIITILITATEVLLLLLLSRFSRVRLCATP